MEYRHAVQVHRLLNGPRHQLAHQEAVLCVHVQAAPALEGIRESSERGVSIECKGESEPDAKAAQHYKFSIYVKKFGRHL